MCPGVGSHPHQREVSPETLPGPPRPPSPTSFNINHSTILQANPAPPKASSNLHRCSASIGILIVILAVYHGVVVPRARLNFYFFPTYTPAEGSIFPAPNYEELGRQAVNLLLHLYLGLGMACEWAGTGMSGIRIYLLFFKLWSLGPRRPSGARVVAERQHAAPF